MTGAPDWRSIPAKAVDWRGLARGLGKTGHAGNRLALLCLDSAYGGDWKDRTLGEIADMGEWMWRRENGIGDVAVAVIKTVIDRAAEGKNVTTTGPSPDAYIPKCERQVSA